MSRGSRLVLLAALCLSSALVGGELMATAVALPRIVVDLSDWTQLREASWVVNGYLLAFIAAMPLAGRAADRYGLPPLLLGSLGIFALGSLLAGAAGSLEQLVAARVVQGFGGGAILPLATAGASLMFSGPSKARALGAVSAANFLGMAMGPFLGATILEHFDLGPALLAVGLADSVATSLLVPAWRWVFYLGAPAALIGLAWSWVALAGWDRRPSPGRLDVLGAGLVTAALAGGLVCLTTLGEPETTGALPVSLVAGVVFLVATATAIAHARRTPDPFLDPRLLRDRIFRAAALVSLLTGYALATAIVGAAVWVDRVRYAGPPEQRAVLGSLALAMAIGAIGSGYLLKGIRVVPLAICGLLLATAGMVVLGTSDQGTQLPVLLAALALFGLGFGLTVTPRSTAALESLGQDMSGIVSAGVTVARMAGMAIGLAVLTGFGSQRIEGLSVVLTDAIARDVVLPVELRGRPLADPMVVDVLERWASAQAASILAGLFLVAAGVLVAAIRPTHRMRGAPENLDPAPSAPEPAHIPADGHQAGAPN
ncbi:MAG: MFS transporter, partial [Chloroflexi bacterium]|nr:MFS transporter [Chloroflexota bacterium]